MTSSSHKIIITGANGQLGHALQTHADAIHHTLIPLSHHDLDILDGAAITNAIAEHQATLIVNCAAYTAVDKAESETERCYAINHDGASNLAKACHATNIPLIHISTDYVFDGKQSRPYLETDNTQPINVYGQSKLDGEKAIEAHCPQHVILRVSGIFSRHGQNFLNTMLRLIQERTELNMVGDQTTCPTYAGDIAGAIYTISNKLSHWGTYHYCSTPAASWYDFAAAIVAEASRHNAITLETLNCISAADYKTAATRPAYSVLDCHKILSDYGIQQPNWRQSLTTLF